MPTNGTEADVADIRSSAMSTMMSAWRPTTPRLRPRARSSARRGRTAAQPVAMTQEAEVDAGESEGQGLPVDAHGPDLHGTCEVVGRIWRAKGRSRASSHGDLRLR
jgi:hypothetical protein